MPNAITVIAGKTLAKYELSTGSPLSHKSPVAATPSPVKRIGRTPTRRNSDCASTEAIAIATGNGSSETPVRSGLSP